MSLFKRPYEISLWEDRLTLVDANGNEYDRYAPDNVMIATSYYKEIKLCVIGANDFDAPIRAINPELKRNINGSNTLSFSIYSKYYDEQEEALIDNPFLPYLTNERKVKVKFYEKDQLKWLDFIIKNISENSESRLFTYTANDLFVNELSKTGYGLIFDAELENNQGTVNELGAKVLEGTDWKIGENSENIQQLKEEALYKIVLSEAIEVTNIETNAKTVIPEGETIYTFYSCIANKESDFFQLIYNQNGQYLIDENRVIYNANSYYLSFVNPELSDWPYFAKTTEYTNEYKGERLVRSQKQAYDPILDQYVKVYLDSENKEVYGYEKVQYISPELIKNYISNSSDFTSTSGWEQKDIKELELAVVPDFEVIADFSADRESTIKFIQTVDNFLFNSGIRDSATDIKEFVEGDQYGFRLKCGILHDTKTRLITPTVKFKVVIKSYGFDSDGKFKADDESTEVLFEGVTGNHNARDPEGYFNVKLSSKFAVTNSELLEKDYGIFVTAVDEDNNVAENEYYIQDMQFFKIYYDEKGDQCLPNGYVITKSKETGLDTIEENLQSYVKTDYYYYYPQEEITEEKEIEYLHIGDKSDIYLPKYNSNYEKIRSISASGSNRFNLLQTLAETFECWCKIDVKHKETGEIMLWKDIIEETTVDAGTSTSVLDEASVYDGGTTSTPTIATVIENRMLQIEKDYFPQKFITFHKNIGQVNNVDFIYGINLKSITRTLESNAIVSKLIVKDNSNEFAVNGTCTITRAEENPSGENFLIDFDYYIKQGLLNYENFYNDLYSLNRDRGWLGYYTRLKNFNKELLEIIDEREALASSLLTYNSNYQADLAQYEGGIELLREKEQEFVQLTQKTFDEIEPNNTWLSEPKVLALGRDIVRLRAENKTLYESYTKAKANVDNLNEKIGELNTRAEELKQQKRTLISTFENKYARFIQEGPWNSEDYIDDNLYYIDAESTLHNSAQPEVNYTINVIEISQIEGYENYSYELGDITHMQDTEFFGWTYNNNIKSPYREKIVVTEMTIYFDTPEKDTVKVQNYRTQFEDLFQRMTAATQQVEFYSGAYNRAANVVNTNGTISSEALADAFSNNEYILRNVANQSVTWDNGITTTNTQNPSEIVRITSGGIFLSINGGQTWTTGITGRGINAKTITTGQLNTEVITIVNNNQPTFRWDASGINAYKKGRDGIFDNKEYVRFDQFGIYGMKNASEAPQSLTDVWEKAHFSLTWKGFRLKNSTGTGSVSIDTENDFIIRTIDKTTNQEREIIQIGRLGEQSGEEDNRQYGILIKNELAQEVFKATQEETTIGGWIVKGDCLYSSKTTVDEEGEETVQEVYLFSRDQETTGEVILDIDSTKNVTDWRLVIGRNFGVTSTGGLYAKDAFIEGQIIASHGTIGGIEISENGSIFIPSDAIIGSVSRAAAIEVKKNGVLIFKADDGTTDEDETTITPEVYIAGWNVDANSLFLGEEFEEATNFFSTGNHGFKFDVGEYKSVSNLMLKAGENFGVTKDGILYAKSAKISGEINADTGEIGGWSIDATSLSTTGITLNSVANSSSSTPVLKTSNIKITENKTHFYSGTFTEAGPFTANLGSSITFTKDFIFFDQALATKEGTTIVAEIKKVFIDGTQYSPNVVQVETSDFSLDSSTNNYVIPLTFTISTAVNMEISCEYTVTIYEPVSSEQPGFSILATGEINFLRGNMGTWKIDGDILKSARTSNEAKTRYYEVELSPYGISRKTYENETKQSPVAVSYISWETLLNSSH